MNANSTLVREDSMSSGPPSQRLLLVASAVDGPAFELTTTALGYGLDLVSSAGDALEMAQQHPYPVVVIDLALRGVDGYAVANAIGSLCPQTAFLLMTPRGVALTSGRYATDGAIAGIVSKPWDASDLSTKLAIATDLHEKRTAAYRPAEAGQTSVLMIEDSETEALLLRRMLERIPGTFVVVATTLAEATRLVRGRRFDVIITDLGLPDARGVDSVFRLRASSPESAIIVCSGIDDQSLALKLVQLGAQEFIWKRSLGLDTLSRAVALAKERKQFELRLSKMAYYDSLTGLSNRAGWHERATGALGRARRRTERVAVVILDLDGFKSINDSLGHDAGDGVLQEIAHRLSRVVREYDVVARLGGDEFAMLLTDIGQSSDVRRLVDRILKDLRLPVVVSDGVEVVVGASFGVAVFPEHGDNLERLLALADESMYRAKHAGQNRVVLSGR
jgi:diguanylate cyclase (GGDEF)-like protein